MPITASMVRDRLEEREQQALDALDECRRCAREFADATRTFKAAWATKHALSEARTVDARKAEADLETLDERQAMVLAECLWKSAIEAARTHRTILTSSQTWASTWKEEMGMARTGPRAVL